MKNQVVIPARMMKVRLGLMEHDFGSRFDDSKYYSKGHSVEGEKKIRKTETKCWDYMKQTSESLRLPASLFLRPAGSGRLPHVDGGAVCSGVDLWRRSESRGDLTDGVIGPREGGRLCEPWR